MNDINAVLEVLEVLSCVAGLNVEGTHHFKWSPQLEVSLDLLCLLLKLGLGEVSGSGVDEGGLLLEVGWLPIMAIFEVDPAYLAEGGV